MCLHSISVPWFFFRGDCGTFQQRVFAGFGENIRQAAGHGWGRLSGEHLGSQQAQLHNGIELRALCISSPIWFSIQFYLALVWVFTFPTPEFSVSFPFLIPNSVVFLGLLSNGRCSVSQSLKGHTSPVECMQFSSSEEQVVAGSQSGSLRVWDLEAAKSQSVLSESYYISLQHSPFLHDMLKYIKKQCCNGCFVRSLLLVLYL